MQMVVECEGRHGVWVAIGNSLGRPPDSCLSRWRVLTSRSQKGTKSPITTIAASTGSSVAISRSSHIQLNDAHNLCGDKLFLNQGFVVATPTNPKLCSPIDQVHNQSQHIQGRNDPKTSSSLSTCMSSSTCDDGAHSTENLISNSVGGRVHIKLPEISTEMGTNFGRIGSDPTGKSTFDSLLFVPRVPGGVGSSSSSCWVSQTDSLMGLKRNGRSTVTNKERIPTDELDSKTGSVSSIAFTWNKKKVCCSHDGFQRL